MRQIDTIEPQAPVLQPPVDTDSQLLPATSAAPLPAVNGAPEEGQTCPAPGSAEDLVEPKKKVKWFRTHVNSFYVRPGTVDEMRCLICNAVCTVHRNIFSAGSYIEYLGGHKSYYDHFFCPHVGEEWHDNVTNLVHESLKVREREIAEEIMGEVERLTRPPRFMDRVRTLLRRIGGKQDSQVC